MFTIELLNFTQIIHMHTYVYTFSVNSNYTIQKMSSTNGTILVFQ